MGKRLGEYTHDNTKCMLEVNGVRLIDRALACLHGIGVSRVVLVVGYKGQNVKDYVGDNYKGTPVVYVDNPVYDRTNNIYSLFLARDYMLQEDTILLESDLIYETSVVAKLLEDDSPNIALVDKYESWMDGTVVTLDEENRITRFIDKDHFRFEEIRSYYKTVNIYKFSKEFSSQYYVPFLSAYCTALGNNEYYEQVLRVILHLHDAPLKALPLAGETWYEIDDVQDLDIASGMFVPTDDERFKAISSRYGGYWRDPQMLDFCYLVNPYFPPQRMIDEIKASFETLMYILVGNGAAELIKAYMETRTGKLGNVLPTFEEYPNRLPEDRLVQYVPETEGFRYTAGDIKRFFAGKDIDTLLLINPDNPSGNYIPFEDLLGLVRWTKEQGIRFVVDESFVDFADVEGQFSLFDNSILAANPHLAVIKSISKSYGVPGLRLGVLASGDTGKYQGDYRRACALFREERDRFYNELKEVPYLEVFPSQANYFLCRVTGRFSSHGLAIELLKRNILIKDCSSKKAFGGGDFIRLAVRDRKDNMFLTETLKSL